MKRAIMIISLENNKELGITLNEKVITNVDVNTEETFDSC